MQFDVQKDVLVKALRDVTSAVATRVVQPILSNVLIETRENSTIRFQGTDLDITIETKVPGMIEEKGSVTLPGKKLLEVVSKLPNKTVRFKVNPETLETTVTCERSKFNLTGLASDDFPKVVDSGNVDGVLMPSEILRRSIQQTSFAAANYDASSVLGGVYLVINEGVFECTATDGSRLAHRKEELSVSARSSRRVEGDKETEEDKKSATATLDKPMYLKAIVPARACTELVKLLDAQESEKGKDSTTMKEVRIAMVSGQIVFETESHYLSSRLIGGEYP
ncbi:MAG: DNA polymerase III subunit beta, partial [Candidatus Melainabacteria bacterium]|nr:DNA polymerase III subunit beta [Candidatus Melainabacteria bacterium]